MVRADKTTCGVFIGEEQDLYATDWCNRTTPQIPTLPRHCDFLHVPEMGPDKKPTREYFLTHFYITSLPDSQRMKEIVFLPVAITEYNAQQQ